MRRTGILVALALALVSVAYAGAAAAGTPPRGVLTKVEYGELHASYEATKKVGKDRGTPTHIARQACAALTNATTLTAAERGECEASLIYSYRFFAFPYAIERCDKLTATATQSRCDLGAAQLFERAVRAFIRTNAASVRATAARHFTRRCLDYLIFTRQQAKTTVALAAGLQRYIDAVRTGVSAAITTAGNRVDSDLVASRQAMSLNITLSVCRHQ